MEKSKKNSTLNNNLQINTIFISNLDDDDDDSDRI